MIKLPFFVLLATPYIETCDSPTEYNCSRANAAIHAQERECDGLEPVERQANSLCGQVGEWRSRYEQKCAAQDVFH